MVLLNRSEFKVKSPKSPDKLNEAMETAILTEYEWNGLDRVKGLLFAQMGHLNDHF